MQLQIEKLGKVSITVEEGYWDINKDYDKLTIVEKEGTFGTFISRKPVPAGTVLTDRKYWIPFSSLKEEIILNFNKWVSDYGALLGSQAETLNSIQEVINSIYIHLPNGVTFKGDIDSVRAGFEREIILEGKTTNEEKAQFILYKNNEEIYRSEDSNEFSISDIVNGDTEYKLVTIQNGYKYISTWNVAIALPLYAGGGQTYQDAVGDNKIVKVSNDISGLYSIVVDKDGDYIFFVAPKGYLIKSIKMNGLDVPIKSTREVYLGTDYVIYQSDYQYKAGTYPIQINDYTGLNGEDFLGILNSLGDTASAVDVANLKERIDNLPVNELIDKEYAPAKFSGMGRVYLRKNVKNDKNILEQDMMLKSNTIYIIQYDFDLDGKEINIPDNCVLKFNGGTLNNGTVIGTNTYILAELQQIFDKNTILDGIWSNQRAYPEWYGAKRNTDSTIALNCIINNTKFNVIHLQPYVYIVTNTINISRKIIFGNIDSKITHYYGIASTIYNNSNKDTILIQYNENANVRDIQLYGIHLEKYGDSIYTGCGIKIVGAGFSSSYFSGVTILCHEYGFKIELTGNYPGISLNNIINSTFSQNKINGLYIEKIEEGNWWFNLNKFQNCYFLSNGVGGIQINNCWSTEQNEFDTCSFERNGNTLKDTDIPVEKRYGIYFKGGRGYGISTIKNCYFEYNHSGAPTNVPSNTINLQTNNNVQADIIIESYLLSVVRSTFNSGLNKIIVIEDGKFSIDIDTCDFKDSNYGNPGIILIKNKTNSNINDNSYISIKLNDIPKYSTTGIIQLNHTTYDFSKLSLYICTPFNSIIKLKNSNSNVPQITHILTASINTIDVKEIRTTGASNARPNVAMNENTIGFRYFDTTLNKPIYWTGTKWVDATGTDVATTQTE